MITKNIFNYWQLPGFIYTVSTLVQARSGSNEERLNIILITEQSTIWKIKNIQNSIYSDDHTLVFLILNQPLDKFIAQLLEYFLRDNKILFISRTWEIITVNQYDPENIHRHIAYDERSALERIRNALFTRAINVNH